MVKTIYLLGHAKSSWDNAELEDHDRPLSKRGRRSAGAVAAYLIILLRVSNLGAVAAPIMHEAGAGVPAR